uniref:Uncharacterized protein n=1 Tax=Romanomermis culicivorax TaxID=13658 RepID=A0A915L4P7_ROMCU
MVSCITMPASIVDTFKTIEMYDHRIQHGLNDERWAR